MAKIQLCEIIQRGKVIYSLPCRYVKRINAVVQSAHKKKGEVTLRCHYCQKPLAFILEPVLHFASVVAIQVCPVCFPDRSEAQKERLRVRACKNRPSWENDPGYLPAGKGAKRPKSVLEPAGLEMENLPENRG